MNAGATRKGLRKLSGELRAVLSAAGYEWFIRLVLLRCIDARAGMSTPPRDGRGAMARMREHARAFPDLFRRMPRGMPAGGRVNRAIGVLWDESRRWELDEVLRPAGAPGWVHQYWCTEDKGRVAAKLRRKRGDKVGGDDLIAATCVYTEAHHARFLVEHALVPLWRGGRERVEWTYVSAPEGGGGKAADELTVFDPACGSGHMLLAALDVLLAMHRAEEPGRPVGEVLRRVLKRNLFGLDIDPRAVRLGRTALLLRCREIEPGFGAGAMNIALASGKHAGLGALHRPRGRRALLARRFDVVVTNPPFVGFRKLAGSVREYIASADPLAASDLAIAFISRCYGMLEEGGRLGVVAPAAWLTSRPAVPLRRHMLKTGGPVVVASLGQRVFETAPLLFVSLAVVERGEAACGKGMRVMMPADGSEAALAAARSGVEVPASSLREYEEARFTVGNVGVRSGMRKMGDYFEFFDGVWSGDNARDVREAWEVEEEDPEWVPASGGQGYRRWYAPITRRMRAVFVRDWPVMERREGSFEYGRVAGGKLAARLVCGRSAAIAGVVTAVPRKESRVMDALAVFNTRVGTFWLRSLTSGLNFNPGYAARVPIPESPLPDKVRRDVDRAVELKRELAKFEFGSDDAAGESWPWVDRVMGLQEELMACERRVEAGVCEWTGVGEKELAVVRLPVELELERWRGREGIRERLGRVLAERWVRDRVRRVGVEGVCEELGEKYEEMCAWLGRDVEAWARRAVPAPLAGAGVK